MKKRYLLFVTFVLCCLLAKAQENKEITVGEETFTMIYVEGGTFTMGATVEQGGRQMADELPCHKVTLSSFYIGQYEVTQALWVEVMGYNPSKRQEDMNCPVDNVSWDVCVEFIEKLNKRTGLKFRMPTESEWEFAARGGNKSRMYKYPGSNNVYEVSYSDNGYVDSPKHPVGGLKPNELGIYDLATNVGEWCSDFYGQWPVEFSVRPQTNPTGVQLNEYRNGYRVLYPHVVRGGISANQEFDCRIAKRGSGRNAHECVGLRLALDL